MLHKCYVAFMLHSMGRKSRTEPGEQVFNRLVEARDLVGVSRQQLAELIGVHYQTAGYLDRGEYSPSLALALKIADVLAVPVESIFSLAPFPSQSQTKGPKNE
jgi:putative transcriptional regulator